MIPSPTARVESHRSTGSHRLHHAFTLIEVLVVVAIIALLIAILMPSLREARRRAKDTVCMSNLHQLGVASQAYASQSKKGVFPDWWTVGGAGYRAMVGVAVEVRPGIFGKPETYGLPAVFASSRIIPGKNDVWICPLNEFDAKHGNTYQWSNSDAMTQDLRSYQNGPRAGQSQDHLGRAMWIQDNYNMKPYTSGIPRPPDRETKKARGEVAFDRSMGTNGLYQGNNSGFFLADEDWHYYHTGRSSRWNTPRGEAGPRSYGEGIRGIHYDLSTGFQGSSQSASSN